MERRVPGQISKVGAGWRPGPEEDRWPVASVGDEEEAELRSSGELRIWLFSEAEPVQKMSRRRNTVIREACELRGG